MLLLGLGWSHKIDVSWDLPNPQPGLTGAGVKPKTIWTSVNGGKALTAVWKNPGSEHQVQDPTDLENRKQREERMQCVEYFKATVSKLKL